VRADADRREALLEGAASLAVPAVGLAAGGTGDRFAVLHGLYWLVANLTALEDRPVLLVVDDLQWADAPSLAFLAYLARRLEGLPVAVAAAARPALPGETRAEIEAIVAEAGGTALTPGPLSSQAVATLAEAKLGAAPAPSSSLRYSRRRAATPCRSTTCSRRPRRPASPRTPSRPRSSRPSARSGSPAVSRG
jgi:hypothetical protein